MCACETKEVRARCPRCYADFKVTVPALPDEKLLQRIAQLERKVAQLQADAARRPRHA